MKNLTILLTVFSLVFFVVSCGKFGGDNNGGWDNNYNSDYKVDISIGAIPNNLEAMVTTNAAVPAYLKAKNLGEGLLTTQGGLFGISAEGEISQIVEAITSTQNADGTSTQDNSGESKFVISEIVVFPVGTDAGTECKMVFAAQNPVVWLSEAQIKDSSYEELQDNYIATITEADYDDRENDLKNYGPSDSRSLRSCTAWLVENVNEEYKIRCIEYRGKVWQSGTQLAMQYQGGFVYYREEIDSGSWTPPNLISFDGLRNKFEIVINGQESQIERTFIDSYETDESRFGIFATLHSGSGQDMSQDEPAFRYINTIRDSDGTVSSEAFNILTEDTWDLDVGFAVDLPITEAGEVIFFARNPEGGDSDTNSRNLYAYNIDLAKELRQVRGAGDFCAQDSDGKRWIKEKTLYSDTEVNEKGEFIAIGTEAYAAATCLADGYYWFGNYCADEGGKYLDLAEEECVSDTTILSTTALDDSNNETIFVCAQYDTNGGLVATSPQVLYGDSGTSCPTASTFVTVERTWTENAVGGLSSPDLRSPYRVLASGENSTLWNPQNSAQCEAENVYIGWERANIAVSSSDIILAGQFRKLAAGQFRCSIKQSGDHCEVDGMWVSDTTDATVLAARDYTREECCTIDSGAACLVDASYHPRWATEEDKCRVSLCVGWNCSEGLDSTLLKEDLGDPNMSDSAFETACQALNAADSAYARCVDTSIDEIVDVAQGSCNTGSYEWRTPGTWIEDGWNSEYWYNLSGEECDDFVATADKTKEWTNCERVWTDSSDDMVNGIAVVREGGKLDLIYEDITANSLFEAGHQIFMETRIGGDDYLYSLDYQETDATLDKRVYSERLLLSSVDVHRVFLLPNTSETDETGLETSAIYRVYYLDMTTNKEKRVDITKTASSSNDVVTTTYSVGTPKTLELSIKQVTPFGVDAEGATSCTSIGLQ